MNTPKPWPAERPAGCRKRDVDMDWDPVRQRVQAAVASFIEAVEEELVDAFFDSARSGCNSPWCDKFPRGSHKMQSWRRKARICKHILTARQRLDESLLGERRTDHTRTVELVHELARQAHKLAFVPVSLILSARRQFFWKHRLRTIATLPDWMIRIMEAEASGLADQALRVQQQAARRSWRAWLDENTTAGAAKVHQLIREPIGFQTARGNAVDERLKVRDAWAAVWLANTVDQRSYGQKTTGRISTDHQWTRAQGAHILSRGHWAWG